MEAHEKKYREKIKKLRKTIDKWLGNANLIYVIR